MYLMSVSGWTITGCRIDPGVEAMLGLFAEPRSCGEVTGLIERDRFAPDRRRLLCTRWSIPESSLPAPTRLAGKGRTASP